jgi:hypothetical protein
MKSFGVNTLLCLVLLQFASVDAIIAAGKSDDLKYPNGSSE